MSWFPINFEKVRGIPLNRHPGAFGCQRKYDIHTGVDLYGTKGDWVYAMEEGEVVAVEQFTGANASFPCDWWLDTDCVVVRSERGYILYGEVEARCKVGDKVRPGERIADIVPVLPPEKFRPDIPGHSVAMLHLEMMSHEYEKELGDRVWAHWDDTHPRPKYLLDPTQFLIDNLTRKYRKPNFLYV